MIACSCTISLCSVESWSNFDFIYDVSDPSSDEKRVSPTTVTSKCHVIMHDTWDASPRAVWGREVFRRHNGTHLIPGLRTSNVSFSALPEPILLGPVPLQGCGFTAYEFWFWKTRTRLTKTRNLAAHSWCRKITKKWENPVTHLWAVSLKVQSRRCGS